MANNQLPLDTTQSKQTQRKNAIEIIQKKFVKTNVNVEVLNPEELLKDNDATGASNPDSGIAAAGGVNDQYNCVTEPFDP
ncbi:hypothetical protein FOBRF1_010848 [Fusarium oxysporum]